MDKDSADVRKLLEYLDAACELIQEAKGAADGPKGGYVTDHLDFAESWIGKVADALRATPSPAPAVAEAVAAERERCAKIAEDRAPVVQCMSVEPIVEACFDIANRIRANGGEG